MTTSPPVIYRIDVDDRLAQVDDGWHQFAQANGSHALVSPAILGRSLWSFIDDPTTSYLYQAMVERLRQGSEPIRFRFRCDAPDRRRLLAMEISGDDAGGVQFRVTTLREEERPSVALLDPDRPSTQALLSICSWCKRIRLGADDWVEAERAVEDLGLFEGEALPGLTHGMCPACYAAVVDAIKRPPLADEDGPQDTRGGGA